MSISVLSPLQNIHTESVPMISNCPHLNLQQPLSDLIKTFRGATCLLCSYKGKNQWLCLQNGCSFVGCGSKGGDHGTIHSTTKNHPVSVNIHNRQIFCQICNSAIVLSTQPSLSNTVETKPCYPKSKVFDAGDEKPLGTPGLLNLGNTCYMNAALQTLSNCPQLTEYFLQCSGLFKSCRSSLLPRFVDFLSRVWLPPRSDLVSPLSLVHEIKYLYPTFNGFTQHDSQEFLRLFLNHLNDDLNSFLHDCFNQEPNCSATSPLKSEQNVHISVSHSASSQLGTCTFPDNSGDVGMSAPTDATLSIITDVFQGKMINAVRCLSCNQVSRRMEPFLDLSLSLVKPDCNRSSDHFKSPRASPIESTVSFSSCPSAASPTTPSLGKELSTRRMPLSYPLEQLSDRTMPLARRLILQLFGLFALSFAWIIARLVDLQGWLARPALTLTDCLADYFSVAELNGENKYYCERCKKLSNGLNQTSLYQLPEVLCIHLKRFRSQSADTSKINSAVAFPLEGLELKPYLHPDCVDQVTTYDLIGMICHRGNCGGGHYVAYALNWHRNSWFEFDDDRVYQMRPDQVEQLTNEAYVLFYRKRDSHLNAIRGEANQLLNQYVIGPSPTAGVYISRPWFVRFCTCAEPGPICNADFLCEHNRIRPLLASYRDSLVVQIPEVLWSKLCDKFGGGPVIRDFTPCPCCLDTLTARQRRELLAFNHAVQRCELIEDYCGVYAISTHWLETWEDFVHGRTLKIPGKIDNSDIVDYGSAAYSFSSFHNGTTPPRTPAGEHHVRLKMGSSYSHVYGGCWELLFGIYGGGPTVCVQQPRPVPCGKSRSVSVTDEDLSDSLSNSPQSRNNSPDEIDTDRTESTNELYSTRDVQNGMDSTILPTASCPAIPTSSNVNVLNNGDSESGVFSTDLTSYSNFSSIHCAEKPSLGQASVNPRATSLSVDNLSLLAQGDWTESAVSLDGTTEECPEKPYLFNGFHSQSHGDLAESAPLMSGDFISVESHKLDDKRLHNGMIKDLNKSHMSVRT